MTKHRATKTQDVSSEYGEPAGTVWRYSDDSVRRERGRMVKRLPGTRGITRQNAREMSALGNAARLERKRAVMQEAALLAVEDARFKRYGNEAHLAEIAYTMQLAATTAANPRLVDAARFVVQETGYADPKAEPQTQTIRHEYAWTPELAAIMLELQRRQEQLAREGTWLDAETTDATDTPRLDAGAEAGDTGPKAQAEAE